MTGARMNTLASLRKTIGRLEGETDGLVRVALGHADADATLHGGWCAAPCMRCSPRAGATPRPRRASSRDFLIVWRDGGHCSGCGRISPRSNPARCRWEAWPNWGWTHAYLWWSGPRMPRKRCVSRPMRLPAMLSVRSCSMSGGGAPARSGGEPQADAHRADVKRHMSCAAHGGNARDQYGGNALDGARWTFASGNRKHGARRRSMLNLFAIVTVRPGDGSWSGNVMRGLFREQAAYSQPVVLPRLPTDRLKRLPGGVLDDDRPCVVAWQAQQCATGQSAEHCGSEDRA